jgi:SulP family sulfate permease
MRRLGRPTPRDVLAGLVTGLFSIQEGIAYASSDGIVAATDRVFGALDEAVARARDWIASRR